MGSLNKFLVVILLFFHFNAISPVEALPPEMCDNGLDDDADGQIDLNDDECHCEPLEQPSLIPNPSFEAQDCCPDHSWIKNDFCTFIISYTYTTS